MADDTIANGPALVPARAASRALLNDKLVAAEIVSTLRFAEAAKAANTRLAYANDWADFSRWADARGASPCLPTTGLCGFSPPSPNPAAEPLPTAPRRRARRADPLARCVFRTSTRHRRRSRGIQSL